MNIIILQWCRVRVDGSRVFFFSHLWVSEKKQVSLSVGKFLLVRGPAAFPGPPPQFRLQTWQGWKRESRAGAQGVSQVQPGGGRGHRDRRSEGWNSKQSVMENKSFFYTTYYLKFCFFSFILFPIGSFMMMIDCAMAKLNFFQDKLNIDPSTPPQLELSTDRTAVINSPSVWNFMLCQRLYIRVRI